MIRIRNIHKYYQNGETAAHVLNDVSLTIGRGEFCIIYGPSGSGKTTLLNIMGTLEECSGGEINYDNHAIRQLKKSELRAVRQEYVGYIFQSYNLFQTLTARENIMVGGYLADNLAETDGILAAVGLTEHHNKYPYQLSGGQQQRVAIARAIAKKPKILFCDEPTGALDSDTGLQILDLLQQLQRQGLTIVMVTHDPNVKDIATKLVYLRNGKIAAVETNENAQSIYALQETRA